MQSLEQKKCRNSIETAAADGPLPPWRQLQQLLRWPMALHCETLWRTPHAYTIVVRSIDDIVSNTRMDLGFWFFDVECFLENLASERSIQKSKFHLASILGLQALVRQDMRMPGSSLEHCRGFGYFFPRMYSWCYPRDFSVALCDCSCLTRMFFACCYCPNWIPYGNQIVLNSCRHRIGLILGRRQSISWRFATVNKRINMNRHKNILSTLFCQLSTELMK